MAVLFLPSLYCPPVCVSSVCTYTYASFCLGPLMYCWMGIVSSSPWTLFFISSSFITTWCKFHVFILSFVSLMVTFHLSAFSVTSSWVFITKKVFLTRTNSISSCFLIISFLSLFWFWPCHFLIASSNLLISINSFKMLGYSFHLLSAHIFLVCLRCVSICY